MDFIEKIIARVKNNEKKKIVLPETDDVRTLEAAAIAVKENIADIYLIGNEEDILTLAKKNNISLEGCTIIEPVKFKDFELCVNTYYELRKAKGMTLSKAKEIMTNDYPYFGAMLVKLDYADGMVSGAVHSSSDTLRVALQIIKTAPDTKTASSFFLMDTPQKQYGANGVFIYSDCGLNQNPTSEQLVDIAKSSAESFELLVEEEPKVAFLSHSTYGSSKCPDSEKVVKAVEIAKDRLKGITFDGELQFDAAVVKEIGERKAPGSKVAGEANVLVFPDLDAGNIAYKITERLGLAKAYGPVTQGLAKPVNDLSRGCSSSDIVGVVAITALQASAIQK